MFRITNIEIEGMPNGIDLCEDHYDFIWVLSVLKSGRVYTEEFCLRGIDEIKDYLVRDEEMKYILTDKWNPKFCSYCMRMDFFEDLNWKVFTPFDSGKYKELWRDTHELAYFTVKEEFKV